MFFWNQAFAAASASGSIFSGAHRRGPGLLAVTTAALGELVRVAVFVRRLGSRAWTIIGWSLMSGPRDHPILLTAVRYAVTWSIRLVVGNDTL